MAIPGPLYTFIRWPSDQPDPLFPAMIVVVAAIIAAAAAVVIGSVIVVVWAVSSSIIVDIVIRPII